MTEPKLTATQIRLCAKAIVSDYPMECHGSDDFADTLESLLMVPAGYFSEHALVAIETEALRQYWRVRKFLRLPAHHEIFTPGSFIIRDGRDRND